jgi:uncharacterized delta-60 repeat protein
MLLLLGAAAVSAQALTLVSETIWGGPGSESTQGAAVAADGSTYLAGDTRTFGNPETPDTALVFVVKFAGDGSLAWQRSWDGPDRFLSDAVRDVATAPDGSVYVAGATLGIGGDALLLKFAPDGTLLWQQTWGTGSFESAEAVAVGADGSVYLAGSTREPASGALDLFIVKFASDGTLLWQKTWGTLDGSEEGQGVAVGPDGSIYVSGYTPRPDVNFGFDMSLLKLDPAGNLVWQRTYAAGEGVDSRGGVALAPDGSVYVAGGIFDPRTSDLNAVLVKFTAEGSLVWDREWGGRSGDDPAEVAVGSDGTVFLVGSTNSFGAGIDDAFLVQLEPSGRAIDARTWGGAGLDKGSGLGVAPDGTVSLGATAEDPPYSFLRAPAKTARVRRATVGTPSIALVDASGTVADAGGVAGTPTGTTTDAPGFDAALVRIAP